eukprot:scaffold166461_cov43-Prasinocladus_malaysianus.AAC.4
MAEVPWDAIHFLLLLSVEADSMRYHQRAWTFQEFCASRSLRLVDEMYACEDPGTTATPATPEELQTSSDLRVIVQRSMYQCRPLWVSRRLAEPRQEAIGDAIIQSISGKARGAASDARVAGCLDHIPDLEERVRRYLELSPRLHCMEEADRVRALLPVLLNCPVEHHTELVCLVEHLMAKFPAFEGIANAYQAITGLSCLLMSDPGSPQDAKLSVNSLADASTPIVLD